jgi:hypothetical protein
MIGFSEYIPAEDDHKQQSNRDGDKNRAVKETML